MKLKKDKLDGSHIIPTVDDPEGFAAAVEKNEGELQAYITECRSHLESLRDAIYKTLDAGLDNASLFQAKNDSPVPFAGITPSAFLKKAYTVQEYDAEGNGIENRDQPYIQAGLDFTKFCESESLSDEHKLLADASSQTAAINTAISQLNRLEMCLKKKDYEKVYILKETIDNGAQTVLETAKNSKMIQTIPNQNFVQKILSSIAEAVGKIGGFFSNLGKSETQKFKERFTEVKDKVAQQRVEANATPEPDAAPSAETQFKP
ncbi:hypothetical protein [Legionella shakespearei]|uniref:Uncharacterized protein n=1 Tax=Legionella shakespearei DSM 23087 TaxID=1122169 RepID=A0A0W0YKS9_9GAMM|nr:hypothetical protein [Legionella shakespearei]KTD57300.1 hypothetical protein Lsha_2682 [Legionella shakespearei DSM 23087]